MKFREVPGHESLKRELRELVESRRVPHALMLSGAPGAGKMLLARALAQYIHCTHPEEGEPCGRCTSCRLHEDLSHPDMHWVYPIVKSKQKGVQTSADRIEEWKEMLREHASMPIEEWLRVIDAGNSQVAIHVEDATSIVQSDSYPPITGGKKIFVVWQPERMNVEAANKILKVLEEPSESTQFIFVSDNELNLLPTIYSRVRRYGVSPLSDAEIEEYLRERYHFPEAKAMEYGRLSCGSLIRADEFGANSGESNEFLERYQEIMRAAYAKRVLALRLLADTISQMGREKMKRFLGYMARMVRENFIYNMRMPALSRLTPEEENFSRRFSPYVNHLNVEDFMRETDRAIRDIESNGNAKLVMFDYFLYCIILLHRKDKNQTR